MRNIVCDMCGKQIKEPREAYVVRVYKPYMKKLEVLTDKQRDPIKIDEMIGDRVICADVCKSCYPTLQTSLSKGMAEE